MKFTAVLKGIAFGIIIEAAIIAILAVVCYYNEISEHMLRAVLYVSIALVVTLSSYLVSSNAHNRPMTHGISVGVGSVLALSLISFACNGKIGFSIYTLTVVVGGITAACLGGVLAKR